MLFHMLFPTSARSRPGEVSPAMAGLLSEARLNHHWDLASVVVLGTTTGISPQFHHWDRRIRRALAPYTRPGARGQRSGPPSTLLT